MRKAKKLRDQILAKRDLYDKFGLDEPKRPEPARSFKQIATMWLTAREADDSLKPSTLANGRRIVNCVLIPYFGATLMKQINVEHIENFIGDLRKKYTRSTVYLYFSCMRTIFRQAVRRDWFSGRNPFDRLERKPTPGPGRDIVLTESEATALLGQLTGQLYIKSALALYTGLRWGEVHGLAWADLALDADEPTLTVRRSYRGTPKNEASAATVPLNNDAVALMHRWRTQQHRDCLWVFPNRKGLLHAHAVGWDRTALYEATRQAGIDKHITPHVFPRAVIKQRNFIGL